MNANATHLHTSALRLIADINIVSAWSQMDICAWEDTTARF